MIYTTFLIGLKRENVRENEIEKQEKNPHFIVVALLKQVYDDIRRYVALQHDMFHFVQRDIYSLCSYSI